MKPFCRVFGATFIATVLSVQAWAAAGAPPLPYGVLNCLAERSKAEKACEADSKRDIDLCSQGSPTDAELERCLTLAEFRRQQCVTRASSAYLECMKPKAPAAAAQ